MKQYVQIIGGVWRGKKIHFPPNAALRPTPSRVRETLFNWLMHSIRDARCLDAFAGSGALGFEALSRGAYSVDFVELCRDTAQYLKKTAAEFTNAQATIHPNSTFDYLAAIKQPYDIIFLDPPFSGSFLQQSIEIIQSHPCVEHNGLLYIESSEQPLLNSAFVQLKQKKAGQVFYSLYQNQV